jgi:2-hydroxychromene-2-carboxylate isomerase
LPFEVPLLETTARPLYQRISAEVRRLRRLGLSLSRIAAHLDVSDKTAARALAWADAD